MPASRNPSTEVSTRGPMANPPEARSGSCERTPLKMKVPPPTFTSSPGFKRQSLSDDAFGDKAMHTVLRSQQVHKATGLLGNHLTIERISP